MEEKYNSSGENEEENRVEEPDWDYQTTLSDTELEEMISQDPNRPCVFTDEEKIQQIKQGIEQIERGDFVSHEDVLQSIKRKYSS